MTPSDSRLRTSGFAIGAAATALILVLSILAIFVAAITTQRQQERGDDIRASLITITDLRAAIGEAEVGVDDYIMSSGVAGVPLYQDAQARVSADVRLLATIQGYGDSARPDIAQVQRLAPAYLSDLREVISLERAGQSAVAMRQMSVGPVERDVRALREIITRIQAAGSALLRGELTSVEDSQRLLTIILIITTLVDLASFIAILALVRRTATLREQFAQERVRAEEQARVTALEETNRRMTDFLGVASHEIRTPLTSLKIGLQLAARDVRQAASEASPDAAASLASVGPLLDRALASTSNLERLAADLVDATRIETSALMMRPASQDLGALVKDCVMEQRLYHPGRSIALSTPDSEVIILADADRIRQVITNYLINALKFSGEERPVAVELTADGQNAMVRVRDEGPGIPLEERDRIWERFYRAPGIMHKTGSSEGFGLGLYICKSIIERHSGVVGVESAIDQGSTFWFTLPLAATFDARATSPAGLESASPDAVGLLDPAPDEER